MAVTPDPASSARRSSSPKKAASKKSASKKASAKKAPSRKSASATASTKKPASAKKASSKKASAKQSASTKPASRKPASSKPSPDAPPTSTVAQPVATAPSGGRRLAACASITEDLLNDLVLFGVGAGVPLDPIEQELALPGMGDVQLRIALTVTGVRFDLRADDGGRARTIVSAMGDVAVRSTDMEGDEVEGTAAAGMPLPQVPIPVRVEALVDPFMELLGDHTVTVGLDLGAAELVALGVDQDAPAPEGMPAETWAGLVQMAGMMFGMMGGGLFDSLGAHVGTISAELGADVGGMMADLGVAVGPAEVSVSSGLLSFHLPAHDRVVGRAEPVPVAGKKVGIGLASSGVDHLARELMARAIGDLPLPFELEVDLSEQQVGAALRQTRLVSQRFPDLRTAIRTEVRPRLVRGRLELSVRAAWLELPPVLPSMFNSLSRRLGGLVSLAPLNFRFPATVQVPIVPGTDDTVPIVVDDLRVTADGVGVVLGLG